MKSLFSGLEFQSFFRSLVVIVMMSLSLSTLSGLVTLVGVPTLYLGATPLDLGVVSLDLLSLLSPSPLLF